VILVYDPETERCCTALLSLFYYQQNLTHLHLRLCVLQNTIGVELVRRCLGNPEIVWISLFKEKNKKEKLFPISFGAVKVLPNLCCAPVILLRSTCFRKAPFTETQGWNAEIDAGCSLDWREVGSSSVHESASLEVMARLLPCPPRDTAIQQAEKPASFISPHSFCPSQAAGGDEIAQLSSCLFFAAKWKWAQWLSCRQALPWLCPFKSKYLQFSKSKVQVQ